jgi:hypothetical protein
MKRPAFKQRKFPGSREKKRSERPIAPQLNFTFPAWVCEFGGKYGTLLFRNLPTMDSQSEVESNIAVATKNV